MILYLKIQDFSKRFRKSEYLFSITHKFFKEFFFHARNRIFCDTLLKEGGYKIFKKINAKMEMEIMRRILK